MGVTVNLPNTFSNGVTADAGQVNANNTALVNALQNAANVNGDTFTGKVSFNNNGFFTPASPGANTAAPWCQFNYYDSTNTARAFAWIVGSTANFTQDSMALWYGVSPTSVGTLLFGIDKGGAITGKFGNVLQALSGGYKVQSATVAATAAGTYTVNLGVSMTVQAFVASYFSNGNAASVPATITAFTNNSVTVYIPSGYSGGYIDVIAIGT